MIERRSSLPVGVWVLVLGGVGFAAGFFGPIALNPGANQGPLLGLFITGPGGALLGLALGVLVRILSVDGQRQYRLLAVAASVLGLGTLYFCLPGPELQGVLIEGEVQRCQAPEELAEAAIDHWTRRMGEVTWAEPRAGWRQEVPTMLRATSGVVLTIDVQRQDRLMRHRKPWSSGRLSVEGRPSTPGTEQYFADFAGGSCAGYGGPLPTLFVKQGQGSSAWPPDDLANFLGLARLEVASAQYLELRGRSVGDP